MNPIQLFLFTFLIIAATAAHAQQTPDNAIDVVGGQTDAYSDTITAEALSLRTYFRVSQTKETLYQCTASALTSRIILTAAHCALEGGERTQMELRDAFGKMIIVRGDRAYVHPSYAQSKDNDLALIYLRKDLPQWVHQLALPLLTTPLIFDKIEAAGFGRNNGYVGTEGHIGILRSTILNVLNFKILDKIFLVDQTHDTGICQGDSGGPAILEQNGKKYIVGVVSKTLFFPSTDGTPTNQCNYHGAYVNLQNPELNNWLVQMLIKLTLESPVDEAAAKVIDL